MSLYVFYLSMEVKVSSVINWGIFNSQCRLGDGSTD